MGYRTLVILYNDQCNEWSADMYLGRKIANGMYDTNGAGKGSDLGYGKVVSCEHADVQSVMILDSYSASHVVHSNWSPNEDGAEIREKLLRQWAKEDGYRLVKIKKDS